jgi:mannose-1-phosphate guanylyltransferase/mannose-6-phosphate isomerase
LLKAKNLYAVIMAGGKGTRFWPLSRETFPKQFLRITGEKTLLQSTIERLETAVPPARIMIITTGQQKDLVRWQAGEELGQIVVEPQGRNTAAAIALAAFKLRKMCRGALMLVMPSDHFIGEPGLFLSAVRKALPAVRAGSLVTFGIVPTRPETGYGYIKASGKRSPGGIYKVEKFIEKPSLKKAQGLLKEGACMWNSGIFFFRAETVIGEIRKYMPSLYKAFSGIAGDLNTEKETDALKRIYPGLKDESIDYGVMERSGRVKVMKADFKWSDIGSWKALDDIMEKDASGNVVSGNVVDIGSRDSISFSSGRLVASIGLEGMVVVDTQDATLICPKDRVQEVKQLVQKLKEDGKHEYLLPKVEERPWGYFSVLEKGPAYQIKHICLKPKARLSLQMHNHRSEHWIVVSGTARVQRGDEVFFVNKNESTYIPVTTKHRLENPGLIPLKIIEIQSGEHLGEDDIIRFEDIYGRRTD